MGIGKDVELVLERPQDPVRNRQTPPPRADQTSLSPTKPAGAASDTMFHSARNLRVGIRSVVEQGVRPGRVECARWSGEAKRRTGTRDVCGADRPVAVASDAWKCACAKTSARSSWAETADNHSR